MGAITLDGKVTRDEIFVDLKQRVAALTASGRTPGLGTILVGDDPGSQAYVRGKHADCAKVGITSLRRDLPAVQRPWPLHDHAGPVNVLLDALKIEQVEDGRLVERRGLAE